MAYYSASLNSEARSKSSSKSSDDVFYESKRLEAAHIVDLLLKEIVYLTGGRDKEGGPILTFPMHREPVTFNQKDIYDCIEYLSQIPSEESQWQGFTVIIDNRSETWSDLYYLLEVLKKSLHEQLKRILILKTSPEDNPGRLNIDIADRIQYVTLKQLTNFISPYQLTENLGGQLPFKHSHWLQNRMDFEKFMKDSKSASNHLDHAEAQIHRVSAKDNSLSPVADLKRRHKWNNTVMSVPANVINYGKILLNQLQKNGEQSFSSEEDTVFTLDNLETQKQVKRVIHFLERKMERLLQIQENETHSAGRKEIISELQISISTVVDWILGPGEKLLSCNIDIGDTCETAEKFRKTHEELQIKCAETYGNYAELRHKAEKLVEEDPSCSDDILAQRDYMDTVCRSFASRLERRKILLITSVRFHRFAEDLSSHLDELLEFLCSETKPENSAMAATELNDLNEKCKEIDQLAIQTLNDGQSLLDEMSRPMKNSIGVDITPDYASQIKYINKSVEDLQERKLRCDELADVRRLKMQQILQLFTCEKDADQAVQWILELCEVMVKNHTEMGQSKEDAEKLQDDHKRFESTALETYHYGKELLEAALFLRRSLRYNLDGNNLIAEKLERAWKKFSQGTLERTNRLTVSVMFMTSSDEILNRIDELFTTMFDLTEHSLPLQPEVRNKHQTLNDKLSADAQDTIEMGKALLQRLALPIIVLDESSENIIKEDAKASSIIMARLHKIEQSLGELNELWTEINSISSNKPKVYPRSSETQKAKPQSQRKPSYPPERKREQTEQILSSQNQSLHSSRKNLSNDNYINENVANITDRDVQEIIPSEPYMSSVMTAPYEFNNAAQKDDDLLQRLQDSGDWIQVRVHQMEPDIMDIGSNFEEAQRLHQEHIALLSQLQAKEGEIKQLLAKADTNVTERGESQRDVCAAMAETLGEAWKDLNAKLEFRGKLLEQSVAFHSNANEFGIQLDQALKMCLDLTFPKDVESVANMLQQHLDLKKSILESSKHTLDLGQQLLDKVRKMGMHADQQNRHATTAACYGIEHILENLHDRRRYLEEMWAQKKLQLEQCLQLCKLDQEVNKILEWYRMVGEVYLQRTDLGVSSETTQTEIDTYHKYEQEGILLSNCDIVKS
uniref:CRAL-TRIO domain-containing protein n=1 Tax=Octopus bimaculoides TaxID=37653 RepID=A0A0L8G4V9_OCTBM|eukprot:XP_014784189.1 PREDICTED: SEC14 domain and spectrin repeat-containing protein 1-B-like [Octopus bimaculoides]